MVGASDALNNVVDDVEGLPSRTSLAAEAVAAEAAHWCRSSIVEEVEEVREVMRTDFLCLREKVHFACDFPQSKPA